MDIINSRRYNSAVLPRRTTREI